MQQCDILKSLMRKRKYYYEPHQGGHFLTPEEYMPRVAANLAAKCEAAAKEVPFFADGHAPYTVEDTYRDGHKVKYVTDIYPTEPIPDCIKYRSIGWTAPDGGF